jgi:hypothetical protein
VSLLRKAKNIVVRKITLEYIMLGCLKGIKRAATEANERCVNEGLGHPT